jgi:hypothetical protein
MTGLADRERPLDVIDIERVTPKLSAHAPIVQEQG